jgi:hypothetical protein
VEFEDAVDLLSRRDKAFLSCNLKAYIELWDKNCIVETSTNTMNGKDEIERSVGLFWSLYQPMIIDSKSVKVSGDRIYQEYRLTMKEVSSGEIILQTGMDVFEVVNGKIGKLINYADSSPRNQ